MDGRYSLRVGNKKFEHSFGVELFGKEFELLHIDMKLPSTDDGIFNDAIIKDVKNGEIIFIQKRFLQEVEDVKLEPINITLNITVDKNINTDVILKTIQLELKKIGY